MTTLHDRMKQDSSWISTNPATDVTVNTRTHGQHYLYNYAPNFKERVEMSMRSMGKQYDWDLEKYRNAKKPADAGNRRRFIKNVVRFFKNPVGTFYWKSLRMFVGGRFGLTGFWLIFPAVFLQTYYISMKDNQATNFFVRIGDTINGHPNQKVGHYNSKNPVPLSWAEAFPYSNLSSINYVINPTYKQNYKKHNQTISRNKDQISKYYGGRNLRSSYNHMIGKI